MENELAKVYEMEGIVPLIHPTSFVHPEAVIIGNVTIGPSCYIGPCACLRGDFGRIVIGAGSNVQDNCTIHSFPGKEVVVGENGHIGHGAVLHGCTVGKNALIGMNAVVMDGAVIGENSFVAAMALVKSGMATGANMLIGGMPAREIRPLAEEELLSKLEGTRLYQRLAAQCRAAMREVKPLEPV